MWLMTSFPSVILRWDLIVHLWPNLTRHHLFCYYTMYTFDVWFPGLIRLPVNSWENPFPVWQMLNGFILRNPECLFLLNHWHATVFWCCFWTIYVSAFWLFDSQSLTVHCGVTSWFWSFPDSEIETAYSDFVITTTQVSMVNSDLALSENSAKCNSEGKHLK